MADNPRGRTPAALAISIGLGVVGGVLLVLGLIVASDPLVLSGVAAGVLSLIAVLVWREALIVEWHRQRDGRGNQP